MNISAIGGTRSPAIQQADHMNCRSKNARRKSRRGNPPRAPYWCYEIMSSGQVMRGGDGRACDVPNWPFGLECRSATKDWRGRRLLPLIGGCHTLPQDPRRTLGARPKIDILDHASALPPRVSWEGGRGVEDSRTLIHDGELLWRSIRLESVGSAQKLRTSPTFSRPTKLRGTRSMRPASASAAADQSSSSLRRIRTKAVLNGPAQPAAPNVSSATAPTFGKTPSLRAGRAPNATARPAISQSASPSMSRRRDNSPMCGGSRSASAVRTAGPWQASSIGRLGTVPRISFSIMLERTE